MKLLSTTLASACLVLSATGAAAGDMSRKDSMHKDGSMTAQQCKLRMETSKATPTPRDAEAMRIDKMCAEMGSQDAKSGDRGAAKDTELRKEETESLKK
jgi:hypothetical protein